MRVHYIHIDADVKNIQKQNLNIGNMLSATADYNNGFKYSAFAVAENSTKGFSSSSLTSIDPLSKLGVRYLISCPQEVEESKNPVVLTFTIDDEEYVYKMK